MFSKSFRGLTMYKMEFGGIEGLLFAILLLALPIIILAVLMKVLPPWKEIHGEGVSEGVEVAGS
jgi:hypothetical protein